MARPCEDGAVVEVREETYNATAKPVARCGSAEWRSLFQAGFVVPLEDDPGAYRISNAGRLALKRQLSRAGGPGSSESGASARTQSSPRSSHAQGPARRFASTGRELPEFNDKESPLYWLSRRRDRSGQAFIDELQLKAGERLRGDFTLGAMMPCVTQNWSPVAFTGGGARGSDKELQLRDNQLRARERFRAALADVGPEFADILVDVCCHLKGLEDIEALKGWPRRTGKVVLKLGLDRLARHYGLG